MVSNVPNSNPGTPRIPMMLMPGPDLHGDTVPMLPAIANLLNQLSVAMAAQAVGLGHPNECVCVVCHTGRGAAQLADYMRDNVLEEDFAQNFADTNLKCPTLAQLDELGIGQDLNEMIDRLNAADDDNPNPEDN